MQWRLLRLLGLNRNGNGRTRRGVNYTYVKLVRIYIYLGFLILKGYNDYIKQKRIGVIMKAGYELVTDTDFEEAKKNGYLVRPYQGNITIYPPGKVTAISNDHISIDDKRLFRVANHFQMVDSPKSSKK
jgi:hypothetical protein